MGGAGRGWNGVGMRVSFSEDEAGETGGLWGAEEWGRGGRLRLLLLCDNSHPRPALGASG